MKDNCRICGVLITNMKNVGEDRHLWPGGRSDFVCMDCHLSKVARFIERTRRDLGLQARPQDS